MLLDTEVLRLQILSLTRTILDLWGGKTLGSVFIRSCVLSLRLGAGIATIPRYLMQL